MNKKRLSVVMAGAMLASSVAPVLAVNNYTDGKTLTGGTDVKVEDLQVNNKRATLNDNYYQITTTSEKTYEVNGSNRGQLVRELRNLLTSKTFSDVPANDLTNIVLTDTVRENHNFRGESVYQINVKVGNTIKKFYKVTDQQIKALEKYLNDSRTTEVTVIDRGFVDFKGNTYKTTQEEIISSTNLKWTAAELKDLSLLTESELRAQYPAINDFILNQDGTLTVVTRNSVDELECEKTPVKVGDDKVDFTKPLNKEGGSLAGQAWDSKWENLAGFEKVVDSSASAEKSKILDAKSIAKVAVTNVASKTVVKLSDVYDGLFLTKDGQKLFEALKADVYATTDRSLTRDKNGVFTFDIKFYNVKTGEYSVVTVSSNNEGQLEIFRKWAEAKKPAVDVLDGADRYETAVKVAKENADITTVAKNGNIVLVNGHALVDGLAAAPLAASVWNKDTAYDGDTDTDDYAHVAPILLIKSDSLPKVTRDYIRELVGQQEIQHVDKITVYLVGGEGVISKGLEKELRDLGLRVVRAGGEDREATSLAVADVMRKDGHGVDFSNAFVVGAKGEADAMSIASVAASRKQPIIVEGFGGLSEEAINNLNGWKNDVNTPDVTIVGGESVVSKATETELKAAKIDVTRIGGTDRKETNAKVIDTYAYNGLNHVVVSKDGMKNKGDLIDALTATSLAVKHNAPIVLGTNSLSASQVNDIEKKAVRTGVYVYQAGIGVARDVVKTIAERVGLAK